MEEKSFEELVKIGLDLQGLFESGKFPRVVEEDQILGLSRYLAQIIFDGNFSTYRRRISRIPAAVRIEVRECLVDFLIEQIPGRQLKGLPPKVWDQVIYRLEERGKNLVAFSRGFICKELTQDLLGMLFDRVQLEKLKRRE